MQQHYIILLQSKHLDRPHVWDGSIFDSKLNCELVFTSLESAVTAFTQSISYALVYAHHLNLDGFELQLCEVEHFFGAYQWNFNVIDRREHTDFIAA